MTARAPLPPDLELDRVLSRTEEQTVLRARVVVDGGVPGRVAGDEVLVRLDRRPEASEWWAELSVLATVRHRGIASLVDHGHLADGSRYLVREWVEGTDLGEWAVDRTPEDVAAVIADLCAPLHHLHDEGFVHADLKPENVIIAADGRPVLTDFGFAVSTTTAGAEDATRTGSVRGTLFSIAPETLLGLAPTARTDLFALGAMLHRLLARGRRTARAFYAAFPSSSFLDAAGTDPEELPPWARDLVSSLTARAPERRPASALEVGRHLAGRLGLRFEDADASDVPTWPILHGREAWVETTLSRLRSSDRPLWIRTPEHETARPLFEGLRIHAALRGRTTRGVEAGLELDRLGDGVALDVWASRTASEQHDLFVLLERETPWHQRGLDALRRACELRARRPEDGGRLLVVSATAPPGDAWEVEVAPAVDLPATERFVQRLLPGEADERRTLFAERLAEAASGSATRMREVLGRSAADGILLQEDGVFRLRPGKVPALAGPLETGISAADLGETERLLLQALLVVGQGSPPDGVLALFDPAVGEAGPGILGLRRRGWIALERGADGLGLRLLRRPAPSGLDQEELRALHARRAERCSEAGDPALAALHAFCAAPGRAREEELLEELRILRFAGRAERALELCDRLDEHALALETRIAEEAPRLVIERARAWAAIGRTEQALATVGPLEHEEAGPLAAGVALVNAQVAIMRHETEAALAAYELAAELDPQRRAEALEGRIQVLHSVGRDEEVRRAVAELEEGEDELPERSGVYLRSLALMSAYRMGEAEEAMTGTADLVEAARRSGDVGLEAAFHINLALMERGAGSLARARRELETAIDAYDRAGLVAGLAHARGTLGGLLRERGELVEAGSLIRSAMETRHRLGDAEGAGTMRGMLGLLLFERGHARSAIETLESTAARMTGAQKRRFSPLLGVKAVEMRARLEDFGQVTETPVDAEEADPRILASKARIAWMQGDDASAVEFAERAAALSVSLKLAREEASALRLATRIDGRERDALPPEEGTLEAFDARLGSLLSPDGLDEEEASCLAGELARRGRNDRAARLYFALGARVQDEVRASEHVRAGEQQLEQCTRGLTAEEKEAFRLHLLGEPDAHRSDLAPRPGHSASEEMEGEILELLRINRQLVQQPNIQTLLGVIVEHALRVTGAERGFLVLEEHGELRFDTALDSLRGDLEQPEFEVSSTIIRESLDAMKPLRVSNAVDDPLLGHQKSVVELELRSIICVPFEIMDGLRGAIYADHRLRNGAFDERAERLCTLLADQAALGIQQLKRLQEIRTLNQALEKRVLESEAELRDAKSELARSRSPGTGTDLLGTSQTMRRVRAVLEKAAPTRLPVLLMGESGTGKEVAARSLHELSPRSAGPFVSESCAALPATLIESELFGHRRGAFTGADRDRVGLIERAQGGTLFLDEIGEMPLELQAKLLRVLETGTVRRIGDTEARAVDFRLVSATNRDLETEIHEQRFRQDLFYRLDGMRVVLPPLSERTEDVRALALHFLELETGPDSGRRITPRMLTALARRPWPGNVRELRNEIARLCVLCDGDLDDVSLISSPAHSSVVQDAGEALSLAELERRAILAALERCGGDKRLAAEELGVSRAKIYQRLKEWKEAEAADG
jgi:transcriptional regulator with GAF, ATPase, and Fis domain/tetratricopeptide (TPR) repeat protein